MRRTAIAACLAFAATWSAWAQAVTYNVPPDALPATLSAGDVLNYDPGVSLFEILPSPPTGATVNVYSGNADFDFGSTIKGEVILFSFIPAVKAVGAKITIADGGRLHYAAITQTYVELIGGQLEGIFGADNLIDIRDGRFIMGAFQVDGTTVNMSGGEILPEVTRVDGITLNISGGSLVGVEFGFGSNLNLRGGQYDQDGVPNDTFVAYPGANVHLFVREASLAGTAIPGLAPGVTVVLDVTNMTGELTSVLADGSPLDIDLTPVVDHNGSFFNPRIITDPLLPNYSSGFPPIDSIEVAITLVPEPPTLILAALGGVFATRRFTRRSRESLRQ